MRGEWETIRERTATRAGIVRRERYGYTGPGLKSWIWVVQYPGTEELPHPGVGTHVNSEKHARRQARALDKEE